MGYYGIQPMVNPGRHLMRGTQNFHLTHAMLSLV
jgi:hypothetical protein